MSSITQRQYKLVLYQAGLGFDHSLTYDATLLKIQNFSSSDIVYIESGKTISDSCIDMSKFDCQEMCFHEDNSNGSTGFTNTLHRQFHDKIADIITTLVNNPNKTLHVKTSLNNGIDFDDCFDSIENQKIKLKYIIGAIKDYSLDIKIYLVGHSQGGLVNLETAIEMPNKIEKIISISTPYSPVSVAKNLLYVDRLLKRVKLGGLLLGDTPESTQRYEERANTLTSSSYYNNLKQRWNSLQNRPRLLVITGTSGFVTHKEYRVINLGSSLFPIPTHMWVDVKSAFDGLVLTNEQKAINYDQNVNITSPSLPCYSTQKFTEKNCGANIYDRCQGCNLPSFNGLDSVVQLAFQALTGTDPMSSDIVTSILEGAWRDPLTNQSCANFYNIYASDFSHRFITQCDETIATILGYIQ